MSRIYRKPRNLGRYRHRLGWPPKVHPEDAGAKRVLAEFASETVSSALQGSTAREVMLRTLDGVAQLAVNLRTFDPRGIDNELLAELVRRALRDRQPDDVLGECTDSLLENYPAPSGE